MAHGGISRKVNSASQLPVGPNQSGWPHFCVLIEYVVDDMSGMSGRLLVAQTTKKQ